MTSLTTSFSPTPIPSACPAETARDCADETARECAAWMPWALSGGGDAAPKAVIPCPLAATTATRAPNAKPVLNRFTDTSPQMRAIVVDDLWWPGGV